MKHIHILGICGTFMGSIAVLATQLGFKVTGCDDNIYPPMSDYLRSQGIDIHSGFDAEQLQHYQPDQIIVGNVVSRGMPVIEAILNQNQCYLSGPQWLSKYVLCDKWVLVVAGTHGKTTTASMLAWVLTYAGYQPGFLIGGIAANFSVSSCLGDSEFFVVEGDEYDTAFFDKRSKFIHYRPRTVILNNLEFDHADIFDDIRDIQKQFHHLIRIVPQQGLVIHNETQPDLTEVLKKGCWAPQQSFAGKKSDWQAGLSIPDGSQFSVYYRQKLVGEVEWSLLGQHNVENALACLAAAQHVGVTREVACQALSKFKGVKRRLELRGQVNGVSVYDDFAHHPTAIAATLAGVRQHLTPGQRLLAILEPRSNTMRRGYHGKALAGSVQMADHVYFYQPNHDVIWQDIFEGTDRVVLSESVEQIIEQVISTAKQGDAIVVMSNGGFANIHQRLLEGLNTRYL